MKVDAGRLQPYTRYCFAFESLGVRPPIGRTRMPPGQDVGRRRFGVVTCAEYDAGYFNAYARTAEADVDAFDRRSRRRAFRRPVISRQVMRASA